MLTTLEEFILEILSNQSIEDFLKGKHCKNAKIKSFFYHGTSVEPEEIKLNKEYDFWGKFEDSMKSVLVIKGTDKMTLITDIHNVIPRTDLAIEYYKDIK